MKQFGPVLILFLVGIAGIAALMHNPRSEMYRSVDIVQLVGCGICLGVALALLLTKRGGGSQDKP